jgi:arylsulfatase A-like enzyme
MVNLLSFPRWHLGYCRNECTPTYRGFDSFSGGFSGEGEFYYHTTATGGWYDWHLGTEADYAANGTHSQDLIEYYVNQTLDDYDSADGPLLMYVAFHNVHSPLDPKPEFLALYDAMDATDDRKKYLGTVIVSLSHRLHFKLLDSVAGLVSGMDYVIGIIYNKLKEVGLYDNTYILFSSDVSVIRVMCEH